MTGSQRPMGREPPLPQRVRRIGSDSFAFLPHRFLRDGFLRALTADELRLYVFLVLAADRNGVSFYSHQRIRCTLDLSADAYVQARRGLLRKDLVAADGIRIQVLSLPPLPVTPDEPPMPRDQKLAACRELLASLADAHRR